jgi:imidazole glycerol-phosphate synthase subunit HisH
MIGVINYGIGNLLSIANALDVAGAKFQMVDEPAQLPSFPSIILPGVGAFGACMEALTQRGFANPILTHAAAGKPLLGICVGMQMLADRGTEFGDHVGLGIVPGTILQIPRTSNDIRLPHIGWNDLKVQKDCPLMAGLPVEKSAYFVHSFHFAARMNEDISATTEYGSAITAAISHENIFGVQFHPEKSQFVGLTILKNFARLSW